MAQDRDEGALHVIRDEVAAVFKGGYGLRDAHEAQGCARACAEGECRPLAGAADDAEDVGEQLGLNADGVDFAAGGAEQSGGDGLDVRGFEQERSGCGEVEF